MMPQIPAAGYTTGGELVPQIQPRTTVPGDYPQERASPQAFGALPAEQLQRLGGAFERGGDVLAGAALRRIDLWNQTSAEHATYQSQLGWNKDLYGDPNDPTAAPGLFSLKGQNYTNAAGKVINDINQRMQQTAQSLPNDFQRNMYLNETRRTFGYYLNDINRRYDQEQHTFQMETLKAQDSLANQEIANHWNDPAALQGFVDQKIDFAIKRVEALGGGPEQKEAARQNALGEAVGIVIDKMGPQHPVAAQQFLEEHQNVLTGPQYDHYYNALKSAGDTAQAMDFVLGGAGGDVRSAVTSARPSPDNNNPGNIKRSDGRYYVYPTPEAGVQAISNNLLAYQDKHGINTLAGAITQWSPPNENPTAELIKNAARETGLQPHQPIDFHDPDTNQKVTQAIIKQEGAGVPGLVNEMRRIQNSNLDPDVKTKAMTAAHSLYTAAWSDIQHEAALQKKTSDAAVTEYAGTLARGDIDPRALKDKIAGDKRLTGEAILHLTNAVNAEAVRENSAGTKGYGPQFQQYFDRMMLPDGDPQKITDTNVVLKGAETGGGLTISGAEKLIGVMHDKRTPEGEANSMLQQQMLKTAYKEITAHAPGTNISDPKGEEQYLKFLQFAMPEIERQRAAGKSMSEIVDFDKGPLAAALKAAKRPMNEWIKDLVAKPGANAPIPKDSKIIYDKEGKRTLVAPPAMTPIPTPTPAPPGVSAPIR